MATTAKNANLYDFQQPGHKLNKQWPVLELINGRMAVAFGEVLSDRLQINLVGRAVQTTRSKYSETVTSMGKTCVVHELSLDPMLGTCWFCIDISVVSAIVDSYFGGEAILTALEDSRDLSRTEIRVLNHVVDAATSAIREAWSMVMTVNPINSGPIDVKRLANTPLEQVMVSSEVILGLGAIELPCQIVYPFEMLKPFSDKLEYESATQTPQDQQFSEALESELMNCELDIRGVLSESRITLGALLELKTGDFIPLRDVRTVLFKTQNMPLFDAKVGNSNGRVSASLSRWHLPVRS